MCFWDLELPVRSVSLLSHLWSHQESSLSFVQSWVPYETAGRYTGVLKVCHPWWVNVSHSKSLFPAVCPFGASTPRDAHQFPIHTDLSLSITVLYICLCACTAFGVNCLMFRVKNYCRQCFVRYELLVNDYLSGSLGCKTRWQDDPTVLTEYNAQRSAQLGYQKTAKGKWSSPTLWLQEESHKILLLAVLKQWLLTSSFLQLHSFRISIASLSFLGKGTRESRCWHSKMDTACAGPLLGYQNRRLWTASVI